MKISKNFIHRKGRRKSALISVKEIENVQGLYFFSFRLLI